MDQPSVVDCNGITAWAENSRANLYPVLGEQDRSPNHVTIRVGVQRAKHCKTRFQIFRIGWLQSPQLQGSYYCSLKAHSSALDRVKDCLPIGFSPPEFYRWVIAGNHNTEYGSTLGGSARGWPMMGPTTPGIQGENQTVATVVFEIWRIKNAITIPKHCLARIAARGGSQRSIDRIKAMGVPVELQEEPLVSFKFIFELLPPTKVVLGKRRRIPVDTNDSEDSEDSDSDEEDETDDDETSDEDDNISNSPWGDILTKKIDLPEALIQRHKRRRQTPTKRRSTRAASKVANSRLVLLRSPRSSATTVSGTSKPIQLHKSGPNVLTKKHGTSTLAHLQQLMNQQRLLSKRVDKLIKKKKTENQELENILSNLEQST